MKRVNPEKTGEMIQYYLDEMNMCRKELAHKMHISISTAHKWCEGVGIPEINSLINLAELFNCELTDLLVIEDC